MGLLGVTDRQRKQTMDSLRPLIHELVDERVRKVMDEIQRSQIKAYESFFEGQQGRLDKAVNEHIDKRLKEKGVID